MVVLESLNTVFESIVSDGGHTFGDSDIFEGGAVAESAIAYFFESCR